jgi:squalene-hopene/tetraprenyl-beta-curcumene cyclase
MTRRTRVSWTALAAAGMTLGALALDPPSGGLDDRIDASRITELDPPPLPERVVLPMPPDDRIATRPEDVPIDAEHFARARKAIAAGIDWLERNQDPRGGWMMDARSAPTDQPEQVSPVALAVTALALKAIAQAEPAAIDGKPFARGVRLLRRQRSSDGSFPGGALTNYVTSIVVSSLASIDRHRFADEIADGLEWLKAAQWDGTEGLAIRQDWYGGAGYGKHGRPDLSNTQTMLDAMYDAGMSPDEPAMQRALTFLSRAQNLESVNSAPWSGNDGGFVYTPANGGESMASEAAGEGRYGEHIPEGNPRSLRSYGSMTYAGFKSMLYAGLSADDARVRAAFDWMRRNWTLDENPGLGAQGLYYYYHTLSRALTVSQQKQIIDAAGVTHNWREELIDALVQRQQTDGHWANSAERWLEAEPPLATVYALLALEQAVKPVAKME